MESSIIKPRTLSIPRTIGLVLHYFIGYAFAYRLLASQITIALHPSATTILPSLQWGIYGLTTLITVLLAWPSICYGYQRLKENVLKNISLTIQLAFILIIVNISLSLLVSTFTGTNGSNNQQIIVESKNAIPFITIVSTCLVAPIVEECVFRSGVFAWLRRKVNFIVAALFSSLVFGSIHFFDSLLTANYADFSYLIVYAGLGFVLAYAYEKSGSIFVSFGVHFLNNALSLFLMFL